jgi:heptosyltransferase-1
MTAPRFLLIKTSSMGDVIHSLPAVTDLAKAHPGCVIDWVVEEAYADIPRLHPAVTNIFPVALRRWRKSLLGAKTRAEIRRARAIVKARRYDHIIDAQGLMKSVIIALLARGPRCGYDRTSAREGLASVFYGRRCTAGWDLHAVERNRRLVACCAGYSMTGDADYGVQAAPGSFTWLPQGPYALLLHATSRDEKLWDERHWVALGRRLAERGWRSVLPAGAPAERERSRRLAAEIPGAVVPPPLSLPELASLLAGSEAAVGVDTGLTHLAAALGKPVVGIYCATDPGETGVYAARGAVNLGASGKPPSADEAAGALDRVTGSA